MAGTYLPAKVLDLVVASANAVTGIQAYQGKKSWEDSEDVEEIVRGLTSETQGRAWFWIASRGGAASWQPFMVTVKGELLLRLDTHASSACDLLYDKVESVAKVMENATTFSAVPANPAGASWESLDDRPEDGVARFALTLQFMVGPSCEA